MIEVLQADQETVSPEVAIQRIHDNVSTAFHQLFPSKNPKLCDVDYTAFHQHIEDKWFHKKRMRHLAHTGALGLQDILQAWHHRSRYQSLQRDQQRVARRAKKNQFNQLCTEAAAAATVHDTHSMFLIINKFTPKKPLARTRLRGPDGAIADQYMVHAMTVLFVKSMWQGPSRLADCRFTLTLPRAFPLHWKN